MADNWKTHKLGCKRSASEDFMVQEIPGKGMGMIANKVFQPGDVILTEEPLIVIKDGEPCYQILQRFDALTEEEKKVLLGLYDPGDDPTRDVPGVTDQNHRKFVRITWANSLQLCSYAELEVEGAGVYPTVCRINHSCAPNAMWTWLAKDRSKRTKEIRACRRIEQGEEVCFSYTQLGNCFSSREERQQKLVNWFPSCACGVCARTGQQLEENEKLRSELARLHQEVRLASRQGRLRQAAVAELTKIHLMETVKEEMVQQVILGKFSCLSLLSCSFPGPCWTTANSLRFSGARARARMGIWRGRSSSGRGQRQWLLNLVTALCLDIRRNV